MVLESYPYPCDHYHEQGSSAVLVFALHIKAGVSDREGCRCQVRDKEEEDKDTKEKMAELEELLKQSEAHRQDLQQQLRLKEQQFTATLSTAPKVSLAPLLKNSLHMLSSFRGFDVSMVLVYALSGFSAFCWPEVSCLSLAGFKAECESCRLVSGL